MPSNLLTLVPLLAGYLFYRIFYYTRFRAQSLDGYRLLFQSSVVGFLFLGLSRAAIIVLKASPLGPRLWTWWGQNIAHTEYSGTAFGTIVFAVGAATLLNIPIWEVWRRAFYRKRFRATCKRRFLRYAVPSRRSARQLAYMHIALWDADVWRELRAVWEMKRRIALNWATRNQKNQLLILLNEAAETGRSVAVSLKNRKYYIGFVKSAPSLDPNETYFRLYPVQSGYREKDTLTFKASTDYAPVREAQTAEPIYVTIPTADVEVANFFDPEVYRQYFSGQHSTPAVFE